MMSHWIAILWSENRSFQSVCVRGLPGRIDNQLRVSVQGLKLGLDRISRWCNDNAVSLSLCKAQTFRKNPDVRTSLVASFSLGVVIHFFATSGVLMSGFFQGLRFIYLWPSISPVRTKFDIILIYSCWYDFTSSASCTPLYSFELKHNLAFCFRDRLKNNLKNKNSPLHSNPGKSDSCIKPNAFALKLFRSLRSFS